jgi:hypothetical protein
VNAPRTRTLAACLTAAIAAAGLAGCGSASSPKSANGVGAANGPTAAQFQARLNLARCLRAHAINVPDPTPASSGYGRGLLRVASGYPQATLTAAEHACEQYLVQAFPQTALTLAQRAQRLAQEVQYAECMRSHQINLPDPSNSLAPGNGLGRLLSSVDRTPRSKPPTRPAQACGPNAGPRPAPAPAADRVTVQTNRPSQNTRS